MLRLPDLMPAAVALVAVVGPSAIAAEVPAPPAEDQIVLSGTVTIPRGKAAGEIVVFSGSVAVHGVVEGDVVVFDGPILITGQVNGSVIAADGVVTLGESARVGGDVSANGEVVADGGAKVGGDVQRGVRFSLEGPLAVLGDLLGPISVAVSVLLVGLALLVLAPRAADAVAETLGSAPIASIVWGVALVIAAPTLAVALAVLVLGLPLGLALLLSTGLWWLVGLALAAWCTGRALVRPPRGRVASFAAGWAILAAIGLVPVLNAAAWTFGAIVGVGAAAVATWRSRGHGHPAGRHRHGAVRDEASVEAGLS